MAPPRYLLLATLAITATASPIGDWLKRARQQVSEEINELEARAPQFSNPFGSVFGSGDSLPASIISKINPGGGFITLSLPPVLPTSPPPAETTAPPPGPPLGPPNLSLPVFSTLVGPLSFTLGPDPLSTLDVGISADLPTATLSVSLPPILGGSGPTSGLTTTLDLTTSTFVTSIPTMGLGGSSGTVDYASTDLSGQPPEATPPPGLEFNFR
jgi:hypothetical protein